MVNLPLTADNKVCCPFHDESEPSCAIYSDHFYCFGCGEHGDRIDWLTKVEGMTKTEAVNHIKDWPAAPVRVVQNGDNIAEKLAFIKSIWIAAKPIKGTIAERYLDETRHIDVTKLPEDIYRSLRFHPRCIFGSGTFLPCLIALMRDPVTDEPVGIQRIALEDRDGTIVKIDRRMLGHAGVVKMWPAGKQLVVGEGLETTLAAATRIPYADGALTPAWAALSAKKMKALPPIPGVQKLILLIDNDSNNEGQAAADHVAICWRAAECVVVPLMPDTADTDFNDFVIKEDNNVPA
jgi:Toprim domain/CHC2 zinc finger